LNALLLLALVAVLVWFWADSARAREQVLNRCRTLCREMNVQLLDQTVAVSSISLARTGRGNLHLRRRYTFEYSITGADRWHATAELHGRRLEAIHMEHPDGAIIIEDANRPET
jgi:hypothetical protein